MNYHTTTTGERLSKSTLDQRVRRAKGQKLEQQREDNPDGYFNFCEKCKRSAGCYLDVSHIESVKSCQENGHPEKAWDLDNMQIYCRDCHQKYDGLNLF